MNTGINFTKLQENYDKNVLSAKKIKAGIRAEELREKLDPEAAVLGLMALGEEAKTCALEDLVRLQFRATILTTILRKCMPDLKAIEVTEKPNNFTRLIIDLDGGQYSDQVPNDDDK